jgi:hypothetical protein
MIQQTGGSARPVIKAHVPVGMRVVERQIMTARRTQPNTNLPDAQDLPVKDLYLDPQNPRLASLELAVTQQDEIVKNLWQDRAVNELVDSIATSGYWRHEELFATNESGKMVVIEGNRRLAAVKLLLDPGLCSRIGATAVPTISSAEKGKLQKLPVILCTREEVWQYIGFKHVNGPQDWDSIAKAQYIARVHNEYGIPLEEIARTIGDRHDTVRRLYRGLMVLEEAEKAGVFDRDDRYNTRFAYSHLWTGLGYSGIQEFLGLTSDRGFKPNPIPKSKTENLRELFLWLYGSKEKNLLPLVRSQNPDLRNLDEVLKSGNGDAFSDVSRGSPPRSAATRGDERLLLEAMVLAEQKAEGSSRACSYRISR